MTAQSRDLEALLGRALAPVEPPEHLSARLEETLHGDHEPCRGRARRLGAEGAARSAQRGSARRPRWRSAPRRPAPRPSCSGRRRRGRRRSASADPVDFAATALRTIADEVERRVRR